VSTYVPAGMRTNDPRIHRIVQYGRSKCGFWGFDRSGRVTSLRLLSHATSWCEKCWGSHEAAQ